MTGAAAAIRPATSIPRTIAHSRRFSSAALAFFAFLALYVAAGAYVAFTGAADSLGGDGVSRVAIANRILFSSDPHLAAIGFVWSPIPIFALLPLVALKPLWPALATTGFAGTLVSAIFMAGAVAQMLGLLADAGVRRSVRWGLTVAFGLHPMILLYAANGMSEAPFIFFLLLTCRRLQEWMRTRAPGALAATGIYLALGYLTRYEMAAAALATTLVVMLATFRRSSGARRTRAQGMLADGALVAAPFAFSFVAWAISSWLITGHPFDQLSSSYGNQIQLQTHGLTTNQSFSQLFTATSEIFRWILGLEPLLPVVAVALIVLVIRRRDWERLAMPTVLGAVLAFMVWAFATGRLDYEIRYAIISIPLVMVGVGLLFTGGSDRRPWAAAVQLGGASDTSEPPNPAASTRSGGRRYHALQRLLAGFTLLAAVATIPFSMSTILNPANDSLNAYAVQAILNRGPLTARQRAAAERPVVERQVAQYVDSLHLPTGSVLLDDFLGYLIPLYSDRPQQYVITSDRDFLQVLADPGGNGIQYVLIPPDTSSTLGTLDAINRAYPHAYATGHGIGVLVKQFNDPSDRHLNWRLYRIKPTA